ncbi:metal-dependent hydrolase [Metabacillus sp. GX 13764]|uniref:metal-dependent hydrolase n=1 Tax=Metabacillus kandeliae TaxID=2900151 RepID=UPI001E29225C|nr:metal-dependent hydrolase [Metabacillus kandeliae]MCD7032782.1 metal-dependent hydrolase [Metabacillus kandeliae]
MKVSYHGHSVVKIETNGKVILIDPFLTGNEGCDLNPDEVKADVILLTHGHGDHVGDTETIAKRNDSLIVAPFELASYLGGKGLNVHPMGIGGSYEFDFGKVKLTQAFHSSSIGLEDGTNIYTGMPAGILFTAEGKTLYHAGDTGLFSDMKLIGEHNSVDLAFLPIGDNFTMGPEDAAIAASWVKAKRAVPIHFNTNPFIKQDPEKFTSRLQETEGLVMNIGESLEL